MGCGRSIQILFLVCMVVCMYVYIHIYIYIYIYIYEYIYMYTNTRITQAGGSRTQGTLIYTGETRGAASPPPKIRGPRSKTTDPSNHLRSVEPEVRPTF